MKFKLVNIYMPAGVI